MSLVATIDVRTVAPRERHPTIFSTFNGLSAGESFDLVNDHDPGPLYRQMSVERRGQFSWDYIESGPELWRVRITKRSNPAGHANGQCCGCCGGT
jgi:uncharacterized protein (DUF2249 family)